MLLCMLCNMINKTLNVYAFIAFTNLHPVYSPTVSTAVMNGVFMRLSWVRDSELAYSAMCERCCFQVPLLTAAASQLQEQLQQQRKAAQDQITQSEQNLAAQYTVLIQQQQVRSQLPHNSVQCPHTATTGEVTATSQLSTMSSYSNNR